MQAVIKKTETEEQIVFAEVYPPNRLDSDKEFMDAESVKKAAYGFMKAMNLHKVDKDHDNVLTGSYVVESFIAREGDPIYIPNSWVVGIKVEDDDLWQQILDGEINGFSFEGSVEKVDCTVEMEIPDVITGKTSKTDDHTHKFFVTYDEQGTFLGGYTDTVDGHKHEIRAGTVTMKSEGHTHQFSFIDNLNLVEIGAP
jgi:hypothetical protein